MRKLTTGGLVAVMLLGLLAGAVALAPTSLHVAEANPGTNWNGEYFNNNALSGSPVATRVDSQIDFNWGDSSPFVGTVPNDNFSVRWTKTVNFAQSGKWTFQATVDDGIRVWIDTTLIIDEWHGSVGGVATYTNAINTLTAGNHDLKVEYYDATGGAQVKVSWGYGDSASGGGGGAPSGSVTPTGTVYGPAAWSGKYWNNNSLSGSPAITRIDSDINFNWATGSPDGAIPADNFSAEWTATVNFPASGQWHFKVGADDGVRMWIDTTVIVDEWHTVTAFSVYEVDVYQLTAGDHILKVQYYEATGNAGVQVRWWQVGATGTGTGTVTEPPKPLGRVLAATTGDFVNVRSGPGRGNPVITQIFYPDNYEVKGAVPDLSWLLIDLKNGTEGWVSNDWVYLFSTKDELNKDTTGGGQPDFVDIIPRIDIEVAPPAPLPPADSTNPPRTILNGVTTDVLNLRDGPSLYGAKVIGSLPQGAAVRVEAHNGNGAWYLIEYQEIRGWVSSLFVSLSDGEVRDLVVSTEIVPAPRAGTVFVPADDEGQPAVTVRGRALSNLNLREGPSLSADDIGSVPFDAEFVIEARNRNGAWYRVTFDGQQGWINAAYVALLEGSVPDIPIE